MRGRDTGARGYRLTQPELDHVSERNFISAFRGIPLWPDNLVPLDEILERLVALLGLDTTSLDPLLFFGGLLGFSDLRIHRFDGVSTVTGELVAVTEIVLARARLPQRTMGVAKIKAGPGRRSR